MSDDFLEHFGVKGMKWGKRKTPARLSTEAARSQKIFTKAKTHGSGSLTNKELADFNKRIEMESKFVKMAHPPKKSKVKSGHGFVKEILAIGATANAVIAFSNSAAGRRMASSFGKKAASGARKTARAASKVASYRTSASPVGALGVGARALGPG